MSSDGYTKIVEKVSMNYLVDQSRSWEHLTALVRIARLFGVIGKGLNQS